MHIFSLKGNIFSYFIGDMRKRNSSKMIICFYSFVLLSIIGIASSDLINEEFHGNHKNIFLDPIKPQLEHCRTSLGEHGRCMPLNDCPSLREFADGKGNAALLSVVQDFGCGFRKVLFVCCTDPNFLKPFQVSDLTEFPVHHHGESHHHQHHHHPPEFLQPDKDNRKPGLDIAGFGEKERPDEKGSKEEDSVSPGDFNEKPVYEEVDEGDNEGKQSKENEESKKDKATTPLWESSNFVVPQEDSWVWPSARKSFEPTTTPDWTSTQHGSGLGFGSHGQSSHQYNAKPSHVGSAGLTETSVFGISQPIGSTGTFSSGGLSGGQSTFSTGNQGFGISSSSIQGSYENQGFNSGFGSSSGLGNQGFSSSSSLGNQGFGSSSSLGNQGFGSSRPGSTFSSSQGFNSGRPSQSGLNSQRPQSFGSYDNQGLGSIDRPVSQGFGNERPFSSGFGNERPSSGLNRPSNYDTESSRPGNNRRPGSQRPTSHQEESFGSGGLLGGGSNSKRPNNQGSNKKPSRGGSNKRRLLPDGKCGIEISDKIIGGENTQLDEFPWMALLHFTNSRNGQSHGYGCGGSLINERYVLTAAHCIKGPSLPEYVVVKDIRLGEYDLTRERDCVNDVCSPSPIDVAVEEIIPHPEYRPNDNAQHHDIALIRLRKRVPFSTYVSPICLPGDELRNKDYTGKQMVVAGWGKLANGANAKSSAIKQKVSLPFVSLPDCQPFYQRINIRLKDTQICAGGDRAKDSCQGDSGGPLMTNEVINGQSSWFATGIVSFGPENCGTENIAGVYTRVSEYVDWILDNMRE